MAGCTTYYDPPPAQPVTTTSGAPVVTSGASGIVESISLLNLPASAASGGTVPPVVSGPYRVTIRMEDGSLQTVLTDNRAFLVGDRVQISDGRLIRR
jgi:hypothetical protein